jgi:hypothetical protein
MRAPHASATRFRSTRALLVALYQRLVDAGWTNIQETATSVDLWATNPAHGRRTIFEVKTLGARTEVKRTRGALSQLLEYRYFDGSREDRLCLVTNVPISDAREQFLRTQGVAVLALDGGGFQAIGLLAQEWFRVLICSGTPAAPNGTEGVESQASRTRFPSMSCTATQTVTSIWYSYPRLAW